MTYSRDLIVAFENYKTSFNEDLHINRNNITVELNNFSFSLNEYKLEVLTHLKQNGFDCFNTHKCIGANPVINVCGEFFKLEVKYFSGGAGFVPVNSAVLVPLIKH